MSWVQFNYLSSYVQCTMRPQVNNWSSARYHRAAQCAGAAPRSIAGHSYNLLVCMYGPCCMFHSSSSLSCWTVCFIITVHIISYTISPTASISVLVGRSVNWKLPTERLLIQFSQWMEWLLKNLFGLYTPAQDWDEHVGSVSKRFLQ